METLSRTLPLCPLLLLALHLGAAAAGAGGDAGAAAGSNAGVVAAAQGLGTASPTLGSRLPIEGAASAMDVKRGPAISLDDLPPTSAQGTSAKALPGGPLLPQGNALVPLLKPRGTRRALARKLPHSRDEEERMAWSTPFTTNTTCFPSGFCFPPNCFVAPNSPGSYSFVYPCGGTIGSIRTGLTSYVDCYNYCTSAKALGAALFHFRTETGTCKCLNSITSLKFISSATESYTSGFTQGLCPYCAAGQGYNPTWGPLCQDCGDCLSRPSISGTCYNSKATSIQFSSGGTYKWWYVNEGCPSAIPPSEVGTWTIPPGGSSFTCATSTAGGVASGFRFSSANNCNSVNHFQGSATCDAGALDNNFSKAPPSFTLSTRATC